MAAKKFVDTYGMFLIAAILLAILIMFTSSQPVLVEKMKSLVEKRDDDADFFYEEYLGLPAKQ